MMSLSLGIMNLSLGILGMVLILIAFILDEFVKRWGQDTIFYNVLNILGGSLLVYYAWQLQGWPFLILNAVWVVVAVVKLVKIVGK